MKEGISNATKLQARFDLPSDISAALDTISSFSKTGGLHNIVFWRSLSHSLKHYPENQNVIELRKAILLLAKVFEASVKEANNFMETS